MEQYRPRLLDPLLGVLLEGFPAIMIVGPRAAGKTTTAQRHAGRTARLDTPEDASLFLADPDTALRTIAPADGPLLLDEWQNVPDVLGAVKRAVDAGGRPGRYVLTGSVRARLTTAVWPATGRIITVELPTMTTAEQRQGGTDAIPGSDALDRLISGRAERIVLPDRPPDLSDYLDLVVTGGFPTVQTLAPDLRRRWFAGYLDELINRDAAELSDVRSSAVGLRAFQTLALNTAGTPARSSLARTIGADTRTVDRWVDLLTGLYVVVELPAWHNRRLTRLIKHPKVMICDSGLASAAAGIDADGLQRNADLRGRMLETFVAAQLRPLLTLRPDLPQLLHLRQQDGRREVDLLVEFGDGRVLCIEVKAAAATTDADAKHLLWLRDQLGDQFAAGVVLHTGQRVHQIDERIVAAPISCLWAGAAG